ncbi:MAG: hypothetical protein COB04_03480 [Gammaproteobacteria bacterium]|nr:MAG: hypothetical protein COB04_03480 [Gammaproteobacteria bacterium]
MDMVHLRRGMPFSGNGKLRYPINQSFFGTALALVCALVVLLPSTSFAAGPRMGEIYIGVGAGIYAPKFDADGTFGTAVNPPPLGEVTINIGDFPASVILGANDSTSTDVQTENLELISLGAVIGYQITNEFSAEIGIDLTFITIDVEGLEVPRIGAGAPDTLALQVQPPELLPLTFSGVYNFLPQSRVSPYVGFGAMLALINTDTNQSAFDVNDLVTLEGGIELGYFAQAGVKLDISKSRYVFVEAKYGRISSPDLTNRLGNKVDIDKFEVRQLKFGIGYPFSF